jgi:regulator of cell morphogenesis and NO signaling
MDILDVTKIEPRYKHPTIFQKYEDLPVGEAFILQNDHDPKPLYYQFTAEKGKEFGWEYLQQGPEVWEVKISKLKV